MKFILRPFNFGKLKLSSNIFYAPLAGCSDYPFRKINAKYSPGLMFCEMVKMEALIRKIPETLRMLAYSAEMHPIGGQICGSKPEIAGEAAKIIEDLGFDVVDLNCGCPVDKVTKDGSGSAMLKDPNRIGDVIANMVAAVDIPVTVKVRAGWDEANINVGLVTKVAEEAGAIAITVHGRTRQQAYKGPANWDYIREAKQAATTIKVIGNGDINSFEAAQKCFAHSGCDGVLVARGMLGRPWIVEDILRASEGESPKNRSLEECREALLEHLSYSMEFKSERGALIDMRRVCCWYLKNVAGAREFRAKASHAESIVDVRQLIENFELKFAEAEEGKEHGETDSGTTCDF